MRVFGIDPGSERTGYGCVETDGSRHRIVACGAIRSPALTAFPDKLHWIHSQLTIILAECRPACVAIENVFYSVNARSGVVSGLGRRRERLEDRLVARVDLGATPDPGTQREPPGLVGGHRSECLGGRVELSGDMALARSMHAWLGLSAFANEKSRIKS